MTFDEIKELINILDASSLTGIEIQDEQHKIKLRKDITVAQTALPAVAAPVQTAQPQAVKTESAPQSTEQPDTGKTINAPMVGTFYKAPTPESDAYVNVGDTVAADSVVCILEAMKLFNEIQAEISGEITEILVEDGQMVEYGQPLFKVK